MGAKRVAIVSSQAFSLVNFRGTLISRLAAEGVEVFALAPDHDQRSRAGLEALGARPVDYSCSRAGLNPIRDAVDTVRLARLLRRLRIDATLHYFVKPATFGAIAAWLAGVEKRVVLVEGLGIAFADGPNGGTGRRAALLRRLVTALYRFSLSRVHRVFFLNREDMDQFIRSGTASAASSELLGGIGVDLARFAPAPPVRHPVTFLMAARLLRAKGVAEYVAAARRLKRQYPDLRFVLLGDVDANPDSVRRDEILGWAHEGVVECPGHVAVDAWLAEASVFVLPSYYREGVPRSLQEAMAMARPLITTDIPGCRDTVSPGVNGFLVPPRDVDALAAAMERFVLEPELISRFGAASRGMAERDFDAATKDEIVARALLDKGRAGGGSA